MKRRFDLADFVDDQDLAWISKSFICPKDADPYYVLFSKRNIRNDLLVSCIEQDRGYIYFEVLDDPHPYSENDVVHTVRLLTFPLPEAVVKVKEPEDDKMD